LAPLNPVLAFLEVGIVIAFALVAIAAKALDRRGFLASVFVGVGIFLGGGWTWFVIIACFFVLGVGFTWYEYGHKRSLDGAQEKIGTRNWPNVLANGGLAACFGFAELFTGWSVFAVLYLGAMSAAAADTVGTEVGLLSRVTPRLITHPTESVPPGTSGGVTAAGFFGSTGAALVIGLLAVVLGVIKGADAGLVILVVLSGGLIASIADSLVGATLQRKGVCTVCGNPSENSRHCDTPVKRRSGIGFIDNNVVNLFATIVGALVSFALATMWLI
jgi:uncharacterized protein (TIGR00297 family)